MHLGWAHALLGASVSLLHCLISGSLLLVRFHLVASFRGVSMPGVEPVTAATVDQFVSRLHGLTEQGSISPTQQALLNTAREVVGRMDFSKIPA